LGKKKLKRKSQGEGGGGREGQDTRNLNYVQEKLQQKGLRKVKNL